MSINPVDRELLRRIYATHEPAKVGAVDEILGKRVGNAKDMADMWGFLEKKFNIDVRSLRAQVQKDIKSNNPASSPTTKSKSPAGSPSKQQPSSPRSSAAAGATGGGGTSPNTRFDTSAGGYQPGALQPSSSALGSNPELEQETVVRIRRILNKADPEKAANSEAIVQQLLSSKSGVLTDKSVNQLIKQLEKKYKVSESDLIKKEQKLLKAGENNNDASSPATATTITSPAGGATTGASAGTLNAFAAQFLGFGGSSSSGQKGSNNSNQENTNPTTTASSMMGNGAGKLKPSVSRLISDGFGVLPENQRASIFRRVGLNYQEKLYYEELFRPSVSMVCNDAEEVDRTIKEIFVRSEVATLNPKMAAECQTARDVCDRVLRNVQGKYEFRNYGGKRDFVSKFLPSSSLTNNNNNNNNQVSSPSSSSTNQQGSTADINNNNTSSGAGAGAGGGIASFVSPNSNPMAMSRMIAQNTLASSLIPSASFLGDSESAGAYRRDKEKQDRSVFEGGPERPDLGPLPLGDDDDDKDEDGNYHRSFSTLLTSAMKFLDASSIETITPHSDKEILPAVFVIECLDWQDVIPKYGATNNNNKSSNANNNNADNASNDVNDSIDEQHQKQQEELFHEERRRGLFKTALAQDIAEVLGWGELLEHSGKHNWRNVSIKQFSLSMAGNVHAEVDIVIPAGISVDDLKSLVNKRLRGGGFTLPRSRVSLVRDLEARPAKLYCCSANFGDHTQPTSDAMVAETVYDERLGAHISPHHRNTRAPDTSMSMPVQGVERGISFFM